MSEEKNIDYSERYAHFHPPIMEFDCGKKCAPYNDSRTPFCCDTRHAIPSAYLDEWQYLQANTDLWHQWQGSDLGETTRLQARAPAGQVLIACQGADLCQRGYRTLTCRSFPFFPYITEGGNFIGLSYYWDFEDRCWVISNLGRVTCEYRASFIATYDELFAQMPQEKVTFGRFSEAMRRIFRSKRRAVPLLHRNGHFYKVSPGTGSMRRIAPERLPRFGPYQIADLLPFPDERGN